MKLVVLMFIWLNGDFEPEERFSGVAQEKSYGIDPVPSSRRGIAERSVAVPFPGNALTIRVVDSVSNLVQENCDVGIAAVGRYLSAD